MNPIPSIDIVQVSEPSRGTGGTLSYTVNVNGQTAIFEMNDDCVWETNCLEKPLSNKILKLITPLLQAASV